ncbi:hypothetical protein SAMN02927921_00200 [Sinomicrobium oceani]|uniref:Uncharacterized protein n=1 Tax=Sinomicrobium oceani TaxID=1150368 RepID=A0A1K1LRW2_9FLAO|nr:hypothetical protein SAMN02927921_00200 [Sinomicrobium oceani]
MYSGVFMRFWTDARLKTEIWKMGLEGNNTAAGDNQVTCKNG